jgi:hypothetical protein
MLPTAALTLALLASAAHAELPEQEPRAAAGIEAADIVWRYDTGG